MCKLEMKSFFPKITPGEKKKNPKCFKWTSWSSYPSEGLRVKVWRSWFKIVKNLLISYDFLNTGCCSWRSAVYRGLWILLKCSPSVQWGIGLGELENRPSSSEFLRKIWSKCLWLAIIKRSVQAKKHWSPLSPHPLPWNSEINSIKVGSIH